MKRIALCVLSTVLLCTMLTVPSVSAAEINTTLLSYVAGDADGDWTLSTSDVRTILVSLVKEVPLSKAADINFDGVSDTSDAVAVLRALSAEKNGEFIKPSITSIESVPTGETVPFSFAVNGEKYAEIGKSANDIWIAQSLDELRACYAYSYGRLDYSKEYDEAFFEDKAVIVWDVYHMDDGLVRVQPDRIVKNGTDLCFVTELLYTTESPMPYAGMKRYILEIEKDDLVGVETVSTCREIEYVYELL